MSTDTATGTAPAPRAVVYPALHQPGTETDGFTRGHAAGYTAGLRKAAVETRALRDTLTAEHDAALEAGRQQIGHAVAVLEAAARALHARTAPVLEEADMELAAATVELAEAVLGRELSDAPYAAKAALSRALSASDSTAVVGVRLNPADLAALPAEVKDTTPVVLIPDASLAPGDAAADYPDGELDARIGTSLARARAALLGDHA